MNAYNFVEGLKVQRFCLTLLGEARLWYQSLEPINVDWQGLQNLFRQQYSKTGNTREQLFHVLLCICFASYLFHTCKYYSSIMGTYFGYLS